MPTHLGVSLSYPVLQLDDWYRLTGLERANNQIDRNANTLDAVVGEYHSHELTDLAHLIYGGP